METIQELLWIKSLPGSMTVLLQWGEGVVRPSKNDGRSCSSLTGIPFYDELIQSDMSAISLQAELKDQLVSLHGLTFLLRSRRSSLQAKCVDNSGAS